LKWKEFLFRLLKNLSLSNNVEINAENTKINEGTRGQLSGIKNLTSDPESFFCILCIANM
jgi:hypothetical protein